MLDLVVADEVTDMVATTGQNQLYWMWLWWVKITIEDFTDVTLTKEMMLGVVVVDMEVDKVSDMVLDMVVNWYDFGDWWYLWRWC